MPWPCRHVQPYPILTSYTLKSRSASTEAHRSPQNTGYQPYCRRAHHCQPASMEGVEKEVQRCTPGVHRVQSPKRYASEDSEGRPAVLLSYQFQSRVNRMFPHALTEAGLCVICNSRDDGMIWNSSGPVGCACCGYEFSNLSVQKHDSPTE